MKKIALIIVVSFVVQPCLADWTDAFNNPSAYPSWTDAFDNPQPMYVSPVWTGPVNSYSNYNTNTDFDIYDSVRKEWGVLKREEDAMRREGEAMYREREVRNDYRKSLILNGNSGGQTYSSKYNPLTGATDFTGSGVRGGAKYNPLTGATDYYGSGIENGSLKYNPLTGGIDFK